MAALPPNYFCTCASSDVRQCDCVGEPGIFGSVCVYVGELFIYGGPVYICKEVQCVCMMEQGIYTGGYSVYYV